jgi:hypothetical protein
MKILGIGVLLLLWATSAAQSRISLQIGWTASKIRAIYDKQSLSLGPVAGDSFTKFDFWHTWYASAEYEYDYKKLRLSTGFAAMAMGAGGLPGFPEYPWVTAYWTIPVLAGYHLEWGKDWNLIVEGGVEIGFQHGSATIRTGRGARWGNINAIAAVEAEWKNIRLGVRGHWGLTTFRTFDPIIYKHTGITTYLGYTLWDHAQCKARRLKRQQEKRLE